MTPSASTVQPTLVAVAHGTANPAGVAEVERLVELARTARPGLRIELGWLERAAPRFSDMLSRCVGPVVVVPALLSTGYHVKIDITGVVGDRPDTAVARQLGPDEQLSAVLHERLVVAGAQVDDLTPVVLFASGSSDPAAADDLAVVAGQLERLTGAAVLPRFLTDDSWRAGVPFGSRVANYLLAPGHFNDVLRSRAAELGSTCVADPIGAHPAVAAVLLDRYDQVTAGAWSP